MISYRCQTLAVAVLSSSAATLCAQSFFTDPSAIYLTPSWRGTAGTEYSRWDVLYSPYGDPNVAGSGINYPDMEAPNGIGGLASAAGFVPPPNSSPSNPYAFWHASNPTLRQTATSSAFIIGPGSAGNIYSFAAATGYQLADTTPYTAGSVVLQWQTDGQLMDFSTLKLVSNGIEYSPTNFITEYKASGSGFGGFANRTAAQWNLTGLGITSYSITFKSEGSSNSFQEALLDTTPNYVEAVPSARTWAAANGAWTTASNWAPTTLPATGGNLVVSSGNSLTVNGGTQEIGELQLSAPGSFQFAAGGGSLKINTGIVATPVAASSYSIDAPVELGAFNLTYLNENTDLAFNAPISGAPGFYFYGPGKMRLNANNTFAGSVTLDGGTLEIGGSNAYSAGTTIFGGSLVLKASALSGSGSLGTSGSVVAVGSGGTFGSAEAALLTDGALTVARSISLAAGGDPKKIGGRNTGAGATFSGSISLNSTADNIRLHADGPGDTVTFSGPMTGGGSGTVAKTGAGKVIFSGGAKSYVNTTSVEAGTLEIASGASYTGIGAVTVNSGATLLVHGSLSGSGALLNSGGTIGGTGNINRPLTVDGGGTLSPGASIGTLATAAETWSAGGRFKLELGDADSLAGSGWDLVNVNGTLDLAAAGGSFTLALATLGNGGGGGLMQDFNPTANYSWKFASATSGIISFSPSDFTIDVTGFLNALGGGSFNVSQSGNDLVLNFAAVPEPSSLALLATGCLLMSRRRKRP